MTTTGWTPTMKEDDSKDSCSEYIEDPGDAVICGVYAVIAALYFCCGGAVVITFIVFLVKCIQQDVSWGFMAIPAFVFGVCVFAVLLGLCIVGFVLGWRLMHDRKERKRQK